MQTILQQPTSPNGTLSNLMYVVSSSNANIEPQFRYIAQVSFSGSSEVLFEEKIFPNSASSGVFDLAHIYNDYVNANYSVETVSNKFETLYASASISSSAIFKVQFGEEYGTSISSSTTEYYSQSTSDEIITINAKVNPDNGSYNFNETYFDDLNALTNFPFYRSSPFQASEIPNMKTIGDDDYEILSFLNYTTLPVELAYYIVTTYDENGFLLGSISLFDITTAEENSVVDLPVGPQNFIDRGGIVGGLLDPAVAWKYYKITVVNSDSGFNLYWYKRNEECDDYKTRFVWLNELGGWDFFNIYLYDDKSTRIKRQDYTQNFSNYSGRNPQYNIESRGKTNYYTTYQDDFKIVSNWLTTEEADWLNGIFESNEVYVQFPNTFVSGNPLEWTVRPINIKNASYAWKTNPKGQKVFQYDFNYEYSNKRQSR